ncbi:MAG: hypothetical protein ACPGU6_04795 [Tenacibaculum sp.]
MKKYIKTVALAVSLAFLGSCAVNDDEPIVANAAVKIVAKTEAKTKRIETTNTSYDAVISFTNPVTSLSRLYYTLDGVENTIDALAGSQSVTIPVDMSDATVFVRTIKLTDFKIINAQTNNVKPEISQTLNEMKIIKGQNTVVFTFTWGDDSDLDCGTITRNPRLAGVNLAGTESSTEIAVLPDTVADGEYFFAILPWTVNNNSIECYVNVLNGDVEKDYTAKLVGATPASPFFGYTTIQDFIKITKTTNAVTGNVTIDLEQVLF